VGHYHAQRNLIHFRKRDFKCIIISICKNSEREKLHTDCANLSMCSEVGVDVRDQGGMALPQGGRLSL